MTPKEENTTYNGAPEDLKRKLKCAVMELTNEERIELMFRMTSKYGEFPR